MGAWRLGPDVDWQTYAACRNQSTAKPEVQRALADRFFADHRPTVDVVRTCKSCPVIAQCLQWALDHDEKGYWAMTSEKQRRAMLQKVAS